MKSKILLIAMLVLGLSSYAQQNVYLKINHKLGANTFAYNQSASNNLNNQFNYTRVEYYISKIVLIHDGGQRTPVTDSYILVKANTNLNTQLGNFSINSLEAIEFGIGVDTSNNHADITTFPSGHALSFQNPSMHWGWAAGYRFVALEGITGSGMNQSWQLHALGDKNYNLATINTAGHSSGSDLIISLDADYEKAVKNITINPNLNYHGEDQQAPTVLGNFQTEVFTAGTAIIGMEELESAPIFTLFPNPSSGRVTLTLETHIAKNTQLQVVSTTGEIIQNLQPIAGDEVELIMAKPGLYFIRLSNTAQGLMYTQKLLVR